MTFIKEDEFNKQQIDNSQESGFIADKNPFTFGERLKLSFGGPEKIAELKQREAEAGLRGKADIGDIADVIGSSIPLISSIVGGSIGTATVGPAGTVGGMTVGTAIGETAKRSIGHLLGVRDEKSLGQETLETGLSTALTYAGGKAIQWLTKTPPVQAFTKWATKTMPERLYKTFFDVTKDDLSQMWKTTELVKLKATDPNLFNSYVEQGVIKIVNNNPVVNPTLAKEIMSKGLWGSPEKMATYSYGKILDLESQILSQVRQKGTTITMSNKKGYQEALQLFIKNYSKTAFGTKPEVLSEAKTLFSQLSKTTGKKIPAEIALNLRRFLDSMRNSSSFRLDVNLAPKQEGLKALANTLRGELSTQLKEFGDKMDNYRIFIEAFDSMVDYAHKTGNSKIVSMADAIVGGGGLVAGGPAGGFSLMGLFRLIQMPSIQTGVAQALFKSGQVAEKTAPYALAPITESLKSFFDLNLSKN